MSNVLGNTIGSNIEGELSAGVYIGVLVTNGLDSYYLVSLVGEPPFLRITDIVSLPSLMSKNRYNMSSTMFDFDLRDAVLVKKLYDPITGLV